MAFQGAEAAQIQELNDSFQLDQQNQPISE